MVFFLSLLSFWIPIVIFTVKIIFLSYVFRKHQLKSVLVYIVFLFLSSYPLSYLWHEWSDRQAIIIKKIKSGNFMLWLGETVGERVANSLYLERIMANLANITELILFIWLIRSLLKFSKQ